MRLPNLLASRWGRLMAFFFLYVTEGIPFGFTSLTMVILMKRAGVGDAEIGFFSGSLFLPWSWKWVMGPIVDLLYSNRIGARRGWIIGTQIMMVLTLLMCMPFELASENLGLITAVILIHNTFAATQDVAIDALACQVLQEPERGLANGLMFAGQTLGISLGGACVLFLLDGIDWTGIAALRDGINIQAAYVFVVGCIMLVTVLVALPLCEPQRERNARQHGGSNSAVDELKDYLKVTLRSFVNSRVALFGVVFALLPHGAVALNHALQRTAAVEIGFSDGDVASLALVSSLLFALMCVLGGVLSDRLGRLKCLAVFVSLLALPTFWCAYQMEREGVVLPQGVAAAGADGGEQTPEGAREVTERAEPVASVATESESVFGGAEVPRIAHVFWWAVVLFMGLQGLVFGTRTAVFMRLSNPDVAATQFTAYMSLMNLAYFYSGWWQGHAIERWGYPTTLYLDGALGLVCIAVLPMMRERPAAPVVSQE